MIHAHVDPAQFQFFEHLVDPLLSSFGALRPTDPGQVVVSLVEGTLVVALGQRSLVKSVLDVFGYRLLRALGHFTIVPA